MDAQTIGILVTVGLAWTGFLTAIIKWILDRYSAVMQTKIDEIGRENRELKEKISNLKATMPKEYVRLESCRHCREEWMRVVTVIDQKLQEFSARLGDKIDKLREEIYDRHA